MDAQDIKETKYAVANMIVEYCYVPGTLVKVFEAADVDTLLELRFGNDLRKMQAAITKLTGVNMDQAREDIQSPLDETS